MFKRLTASPFAKGFAGAVIALIVALVTIHLWSDHQALHIVVDFLNTHGEKISKLP